MTIRIDTQNLAAHIGQDAGTSDWFLIDQQRVDDFADVTKDHRQSSTVYRALAACAGRHE